VGVLEIIAIVAGSNVVTALVTHLLQRGFTKRSVKVDEFKAITDEWNELHSELKVRVSTVEASLQQEREAHEMERASHAETRRLLRIAIEHIREVVTWSVGDRSVPIPEPPAELMEAEI